MAFVYVIAQCLGAFMGYGLLVTLTPTNIMQASGNSVCVTKPHAFVTMPQAFLIEFIATATLIWFCCSIWDPRNAKSQDSIPLRFGLAVAGLASATVSKSLKIVCGFSVSNLIAHVVSRALPDTKIYIRYTTASEEN